MGSGPSKTESTRPELKIQHMHMVDDSTNQNHDFDFSKYSVSGAEEEKDRDKHFEIMKDVKTNINTLKSEPFKDENGRVSSTYLLTLGQIQMAFSNTGKKQHQFKYRSLIAKELSTDVITLLCDNVVDLYNFDYRTEKGCDDKYEYILMKLALAILGTSSESCPEVTSTICNHSTFLRASAAHLSQIYREEMNCQYENIMFRVLSLIRNASLVDSNISKIRKHNYVNVLTLYLESDIPKVKFQSIAVMAEIVTEEESEILQKGRNSFDYIKEMFPTAMKTSTRRHPWLQMQVWEMIRTVKQIARNDTNKKAIVEHGFLPLLVELAHSSVSKEQAEAVATLRTLSFDKENQRRMINDTSVHVGVVDTFVALLDSKDKTCVSICKGALWTMREELQKSEKYKDLEIVQEFAAKTRKSEVEDKSSDTAKGHVMISYQWNNQETLIQIKEHLRSNGFKVWMDIDDMAGSTLEAMAKAVEEADVVLLCFSKKYKNSDNCRAEAEYAFEKRKTIVPLRMEKGYRPDGWLGIIVGSKKFYDFGGKYSFASRADDLVKELHGKFSHLGIEGNSVSETKHAKAKTEQRAAKNKQNSVKTWNRDQVCQWLEKHGLNTEKFKTLEGVEIVFLQLLLEKAVDVYYKTLTEQLNVTDLNTMAKFTSALEDTSL